MIKKIGILTSGGDAPGMNAVIYGITKAANSNNIEVVGVIDGFRGILNSNFVPFNKKNVAGILSRGGTVLGSSRVPEFKLPENVEKGATNLRKAGIEALIVIGGDGSFRGGYDLTKIGINCIGIPATIDNDINYTDRTIGFDSSFNTIVDAIDRLKDTMTSHHRCMVVEVMGNKSGYLTVNAAIACGADICVIPEVGYDEEGIINRINELKKEGKKEVLVVACEKFFDTANLTKLIEEKTGYSTRLSVLGHIQRGGKPSAFDRQLACRFGESAVSLLMEGKGGLTVTLTNGVITSFPITDVVNSAPDKTPHLELYRIFYELNK